MMEPLWLVVAFLPRCMLGYMPSGPEIKIELQLSNGEMAYVLDHGVGALLLHKGSRILCSYYNRYVYWHALRNFTEYYLLP